MTAPTGTLVTANVVGNREDLTDVVYRISPKSSIS